MAVKRVVSPSTGVSTTRSARVRLRAGRAPGWLSMGTARAGRSRAEASSVGRPLSGHRATGGATVGSSVGVGRWVGLGVGCCVRLGAGVGVGSGRGPPITMAPRASPTNASHAATPPAPGSPEANPRASLAAFLSFLFPGLGQAYNGDSWLAWILATPAFLLVAGVALALATVGSSLLARVFDTPFLG